MIGIDTCFGGQHRHLDEFKGVQVHANIIHPLNALALEARAQGFDLTVASGYRSFDRQLKIWNEKVAGIRPILDDNGALLSVADLTDYETVFSILRWSALPGASRHHWGTDVDVIDSTPLKKGYQLQLTREETVTGGVFAGFHLWLDSILQKEGCVFFRPYTQPDGGVAPEPWHISYGALASEYQKQLSKDGLIEVLKNADLALLPTVLKYIDEIYDRFVWVPWGDYPNGEVV